MKKAVILFLVLLSIYSVSLAEKSRTVNDGKGTVVPSKYEGEDARIKDTAADVEAVPKQTSASVPKITSISNSPVSMAQAPVEENNDTLLSVKNAFPSLTNFVPIGWVEKGAKLRVPLGAKYFIALVNGKWISYDIPDGAESYTTPVDAKTAYFAS